MLGLVARCDNGGLGTMCWEAWRHLQPAKTLVVRASGPACGRPDPTRYQGGSGEVRTIQGSPTPADAAWLTSGVDTIYSAETWYGPYIRRAAQRAGVRMVLHVMPEYWLPDIKADLLLAPTSWMQPPGSKLLPVPVAADRFTRREIRGVETLYHIASPDGHDRNGTQLLLSACRHMTQPCRLLMRGNGRRGPRPRSEQVGKVSVEWLPHHDGPYWEAWPQVDALVMPRRYAGLSLPIQEAAIQGLPVVTLDRPPESTWLPEGARVPAKVAGPVVTWRSRRVDLWDAAPADLARTLDGLIGHPDRAAALSSASVQWADTLTWKHLLPAYRELGLT